MLAFLLLYLLLLTPAAAEEAPTTRCSFNGSTAYLDVIRGGSLDAIVKEARRELKKIARAPTIRDRIVVFTHVPKSAGSSVKTALMSWNRFHSKGHISFNKTDALFNHSALDFTIMRKPSERLASLFAYINMFPHLNQRNYWNETHKYAQQPLEWLQLPKVKEFLTSVSIKYFGSYGSFEALHASISAFRQSWSKFPAELGPQSTHATADKLVHEMQTLAPNLQEMRDRISSVLCLEDVPESMRCYQHAEVILMLLNRYSVVGVLEDYQNIWKIMKARVGLPDGYVIKAISGTRRNTHTVSKNAITETPVTTNLEVKKAFEKAADSFLFCENVLYEVSRRIHDIDLAML